MSWNDKVLDNLEQVYWSPDKIGLKSLARQTAPDGSSYIIPKEHLAGGKSLYCREAPFVEWRSTITKKEELLNQVIEIALAIAPSSFIAEAFFAPLGIRPSSRIQTIGREILSRHASLAPRQFTQHDGFYVSDNAIVMMEMKLKARTSVEQYLKYCTLAALEETLTDKKDHIGLVYLVPRGSVDRTRKDLRMESGDGMREVWADPTAFTDKSTLMPLLENHMDAIREVGKRLQMTIITWDDFLAALTRCRDGAVAVGNETLENLMQGMINQILATPDCGLNATAGEA